MRTRRPGAQPRYHQARLDRRHPLATGLLGFWLFPGRAALNLTGRSGAGTLNGATVAQSPDGPGLQFNGSSDYADLGNALALDAPGSVTVALRVRLDTIDAVDTWHGIAAKRTDGSNANWALNWNPINSGGVLQWYYESSGSYVTMTTALSPFTGGQWCWIVGTFAPNGSNTTGTIYKDGLQLAQNTGMSGSVPASTATIQLGRTNASASEYAPVTIAALVVWARTLPPAEVRAFVADPYAPLHPRRRAFKAAAGGANGTLAAGVVTATALSPAASVSAAATLAGVVGTATALSPAATLLAGATLGAGVGTATALSPASVPQAGPVIAAGLVTATALSPAATLAATAVLAAAAAAAAAISPAATLLINGAEVLPTRFFVQPGAIAGARAITGARRG